MLLFVPYTPNCFTTVNYTFKNLMHRVISKTQAARVPSIVSSDSETLDTHHVIQDDLSNVRARPCFLMNCRHGIIAQARLIANWVTPTPYGAIYL